MSHALWRAAWSLFSDEIERAPMQSRFTRPPFNYYDGKTDPVKHVSHYIHMMSLHTHNDVLMCKVFPSSLGPTALRWFNGLRKGSIHSFAELIQEFGARLITCSRVPQSVDAFLSLWKWGSAKPFVVTPIGIGSFTMRLVAATRRLPPTLLGWAPRGFRTARIIDEKASQGYEATYEMHWGIQTPWRL